MSAIFSPCRTWRYTLTREIALGLDAIPMAMPGITEHGEFPAITRPPGPITVAFVGLNPSTADETADDPTIRRCMGFAKSWGYARMVMLNLFAFRSPDPRVLKGHPSPVGPANDYYLLREAEGAEMIVCAWGTLGALTPGLSRDSRGERVRRLLIDAGEGEKLHVLGLTKDGHPKHPLYLRSDLTPEPWT